MITQPSLNSTTSDLSTREPAIEVEGLVRTFGKGILAVDSIDLVVWPGEIYGFLGPNGAGKSTTVLILTTLLAPSSGHARVGGFDVVDQARHVRETIGAALQAVALDAMLTGREHLRFQATLHGLSRTAGAERAEELLDRVGLTEAGERRIGTYSGGMKRRLDLALALVHRPRILFLDEPTTGLDPSSRTALWTEVGALARDEGVTVFLTTQYLEEADALADRIGIIDHGSIVAEGTPARLKSELGAPTIEVLPADPARMGEFMAALDGFGPLARGRDDTLIAQLPRGEAQLAEFVRILDQHDLLVTALNLHRPSLDDVFLAKTGRTLEGASTASDLTDNGNEASLP
jgi:ABC-2 type transport system ATP-binding protein